MKLHVKHRQLHPHLEEINSCAGEVVVGENFVFFTVLVDVSLALADTQLNTLTTSLIPDQHHLHHLYSKQHCLSCLKPQYETNSDSDNQKQITDNFCC